MVTFYVHTINVDPFNIEEIKSVLLLITNEQEKMMNVIKVGASSGLIQRSMYKVMYLTLRKKPVKNQYDKSYKFELLDDGNKYDYSWFLQDQMNMMKVCDAIEGACIGLYKFEEVKQA
jgi:hypothetical protein